MTIKPTEAEAKAGRSPDEKVRRGQFFTGKNVFLHNPVFGAFMKERGLWNAKILEPFAGANALIGFLRELRPNIRSESYDVYPRAPGVKRNDSIRDWRYEGFGLVVTNPPYLAKNSAKRKGLNADFGAFDDLYKSALFMCLENVRHVVAIVPAAFAGSSKKADARLLRKLVAFQHLPDKRNFADTQHPVALAYFDAQKDAADFLLYEGAKLIGSVGALRAKQAEILRPKNRLKVSFNAPDGNVCASVIDNVRDKSGIRFALSGRGFALRPKPTDRNKVLIKVSRTRIGPKAVARLNALVGRLRDSGCDYLWAPFKGVRRDGGFRMRIAFATVRRIVNAAL